MHVVIHDVPGQARRAIAQSRAWNTAVHDVDASNLNLDDGRASGTLTVTFRSDGVTPKDTQTISGRLDLVACVENGRVTGTYTGVVGRTTTAGRVSGDRTTYGTNRPEDHLICLSLADPKRYNDGKTRALVLYARRSGDKASILRIDNETALSRPRIGQQELHLSPTSVVGRLTVLRSDVGTGEVTFSGRIVGDTIVGQACFASDGNKQSWGLYGLVFEAGAKEAIQKSQANSAVAIGWRGDGSGLFAGPTPPEVWDVNSGSNVLWRVELPGPGSGSPIVVRGRVFLCAEPANLLCLDATTGKELWQRRHEMAVPIAKTIDWAEYFGLTGATPVSDGSVVCIKLATGLTAAYDFDGNLVWQRDTGPNPYLSSMPSPLLVGRTLIYYRHWQAFPHRREWWLACGLIEAVDSRTGQLLWRAPGRSSHFVAGSLAHVRSGETDLVVTGGGQVLRLTNGEDLGMDLGLMLSGSTPLAQGSTLYYAKKIEGKHTAMAIAAVRIEKDDKDGWRAVPLWQQTPTPAFWMYASPLLYEGVLYIFRNKTLERFDAAGGRQLATMPLPGELFSSPALAGNHVFQGVDDGKVLVLRGGAEVKLLGTNTVEGTQHGRAGLTSSPFIDNGRLYVRTHRLLYCIGNGSRGPDLPEATTIRGKVANDK